MTTAITAAAIGLVYGSIFSLMPPIELASALSGSSIGLVPVGCPVICPVTGSTSGRAARLRRVGVILGGVGLTFESLMAAVVPNVQRFGKRRSIAQKRVGT